MLENFIRATAVRGYMYLSDEFQLFLRSLDFDRAFSSTQAPSTAEVAGAYLALFEEYRRPVQADSESRLDGYMEHFRGFLANLTGLRDKVKGTVGAFNEFARCYWTLCDGMQEFETESVAGYFQGEYQPIFAPAKHTTFINPFEMIQNLLKVERQEIDAMAETLTAKKTYEGNLKRLQAKLVSGQKDLAKLNTGGRTFTSLLSTKPKGEFIAAINKTLEATRGEIQLVELVLNIMTVKLLAYEMPLFLQVRAMKYERSIKSFGRVTVKEIEEILQVCRALDNTLA
jgi:hypothetical protein